ncbi:hypothetical protein [Hallella colorans]|uniref:hypothetical protein n=1 Tax=Hallella colorans TaxID=1703337 RepID=UPI00248E05F2|nr:hypothetical protein [Hallella colorans]
MKKIAYRHGKYHFFRLLRTSFVICKSALQLLGSRWVRLLRRAMRSNVAYRGRAVRLT